MDKLYIDCNILLDWLTDRPPFSQYAEKLLSLIEKKEVQGFVSPLTLSNTYYILRKQTSKQITNEFLQDSIRLFKIVDVTKSITYEAIQKEFKDFEDDLHYYTAQKNNLDFIITRNKSDFIQDTIRILTAEEYLKLKNQQ